MGYGQALYPALDTVSPLTWRRVRPLLLAAVLLVAVAAPAAATPSDPRLAGVHSWAFAIGSGDLDGDYAARYAPFDLVVVDGEEVTAKQVAALHANGTVVLGYLSVGTIEKGRSWFAAAKRYRLELWEDWGEWYADVAQRGYRTLIARTVAPKLRAKKLDGLFLDNVDMVETHRRQRAGMVALVKTLARDGGLLFAQNGDDFMPTRVAVPRRLEPRGRHLHLRLRPAPLRARAGGRHARRADRAAEDGGARAAGDRDRLRRGGR